MEIRWPRSWYTGRLNQHGYRDILDNTLQACRELFGADELWTFQQDSAPCHTARSIVEYMEEINMQVLPWPASSPDLNPIENLWSWMDCQLQKTRITSLEQLKAELHALWLKIPEKLVQNLVESMPRRARACYKARGGHTKY